jgi:hypothetical protein
MALVLKDRVKVRTRTLGTGTLTLENVIGGFQSFSAVGDGNETYFGIIDQVGNWEISRGTYTAIGNTLSRTIVVASSNNNQLVDFEEGSKNVFCTFPASLAQTNFTNAGYGVGNFSFNGSILDTANSTPITVAKSTTVQGNLTVTGTVSGSGDYLGNATTATALKTARTINGVSFNGSSNITVTADASTLSGAVLKSSVTTSSLTGVGTITSGTWSASFGTVSGANLTNLTAANLAGTINNTVLGNSVLYVGTTSIALNRSPQSQTLTGISIDGNAVTATRLQTARNINGVSFNGAVDITVTADANTLSNTTLKSTVVNSSLTSVGTLTGLTVNNVIYRNVALLSRKHASSQLIGNALPFRVEFDTVAESAFDTGLVYNTSTNAGRLTNNSGSTKVYTITTTLNFDVNSTGYRGAWIEKNGVRLVEDTRQAVNGDHTLITLTTSVVLGATDYIEVYAYQTSGVNLSIGTAPFNGNYINITWI